MPFLPERKGTGNMGGCEGGRLGEVIWRTSVLLDLSVAFGPLFSSVSRLGNKGLLGLGGPGIICMVRLIMVETPQIGLWRSSKGTG